VTSAGPATFTQTSPGNWQVAFTGQVVATYEDAFSALQGTVTYVAQLVATAHFDSASNIAPVSAGISQSTNVIGGATQTGGIDLSFADVTTAGDVTAQAIDTTGLSLPAIEALSSVTNFQLAGSATAQIWNVSFDGAFTGTATLTFNYDPVLAGAGTLSILHFNETLGEWENLGGTVDTLNHTITVDTTSFSPFALVVAVPEPSSWVLGALACGSLALVRRRRRRS
jgi:PEP-CTERM motif